LFVILKPFLQEFDVGFERIQVDSDFHFAEKVLHGFKGGTDGANPNGGLVFNRKGAIYGMWFSGGGSNCKTT
jgi:hypothetical protein